MKNSLVYFLGFIFALVMSACAISNDVHFNKNYSGTYAINVDMGDMVEMLQSLDPSMKEEMSGDFIDEAMSEEDRKQMQAQINEIAGISGASFEVIEQSRIEFKFDFEDVESLNKAFSEIQSAIAEQNEMVGESMNGMSSMGLPTFTKNGKVISHGARFPAEQLPEDALGDIEELGGDGMMDMVIGMMDYTVELSFDRKVKSVEIEGMDLISQDKHKVKARIDLGEMMKGEPYKIDVKTN